jgi:hypothetical protein
MAELFGIDIAAVVADSIAAAGDLRPGTLTKSTPGSRTGGQLTAGTNPTTASHSFRGFVERRDARRQGQVGREPMSIVTILGASVSGGAAPEVNDVATVDGTAYVLLELISRDPASAVYEFRTE